MSGNIEHIHNAEHLVIGLGQIGTAIWNILKADALDIDLSKSSYRESNYTVLHICFPYFKGFEDTVISYQNRFSPKFTIIHSTVPVGTSEKVGAVHSPCRGIHPKLEEGIRTFVKYFGGKDSNAAAECFMRLGILVKTTASSRTTEAMKLWDTTIYGWNIILEKMIYEYCENHGLDFNLIYTDANNTYNEGYEKLNHPEYKKYALRHAEGKIGGHCVINNLDFLDSKASKIIKDYNENINVKD